MIKIHTFKLIYIVVMNLDMLENMRSFDFLLLYINKPLFLILDFQLMNSCEFKEIIISRELKIENGLLGLDHDCYLSIVKFLDSSILRNI
jgi:hypothetical protein